MNNTIIKQGLMRTRECWFMGLCLFCVLLSSCRKDVEFKGEESDPRIVLNAFLFCGDTISFKVSKSVFFLESNFDASAPEGLNVKLFVNDMEISGLHVANDTMFTNSYYVENGEVKNGFYISKLFSSNRVLQEGDVVRIVASAPGFETVEAVNRIVGDGALVSANCSMTDSFVQTRIYDTMIFNGHYTFDLQLNLTDVSPEKDYYMLRLTPGSGWLGDNTDWWANLYSEDPAFGKISIIQDWIGLDLFDGANFVFDDGLFNGKSYTISMEISMSGSFTEGEDEVDFDVELLHLDNDMYRYYSTYSERQDPIMSFFYEPIQTHSNVKNGYGIVGSVSAQKVFHFHKKAYREKQN